MEGYSPSTMVVTIKLIKISIVSPQTMLVIVQVRAVVPLRKYLINDSHQIQMSIAPLASKGKDHMRVR